MHDGLDHHTHHQRPGTPGKGCLDDHRWSRLGSGMTSVLLSLSLQQPSLLPQKREQQSETCSRTPGSAVGRRSQAAFEFALRLRGMGANAVGGAVLSSEGRRSPARRHVAALGACVRVLSSSRLINHSILPLSGRAIGNGSEKHKRKRRCIPIRPVRWRVL